MFRIVAEKRGDAVVGFRVQQQGFTRHREDSPSREVWRNRGKRVFTKDDAQHSLDFLIQQQHAAHPPITVEVLQGSEVDMPPGYRGRPDPLFSGHYGGK